VRIDPGDIQSLLAAQPSGVTVRHHVFRFGGPEAARAFVAGLAPMVTMADGCAGPTAGSPGVEVWVNVGFTAPGLRVLGLQPRLLRQFDPFFLTGPDFLQGPDGVQRRDMEESQDEPRPSWEGPWWEGQFRTGQVHCMVKVEARATDRLQEVSAAIRAIAPDGVTELVPRRHPDRDGAVLESQPPGDGSRRLHFGYVDGISQPDVRWSDALGSPGRVDFRHFVLGHATREASSAPRAGGAAELVRGSTYGVFSWFYQDVVAFRAFLREEGQRLYPHLSPADAQERLAAKIMGRWRDGTPLALSPDRPDDALTGANEFDYAQDDQGMGCPLSAHIRVANPRRETLARFVGEDLFVQQGVPRLIRRGVPYGPPLVGDADDGRDRGLFGLFLCADLGRQFLRLAAWIQRNDFRPIHDVDHRLRDLRVQDAVVANRATAGASRRLYLPGEGRNGADAVVGQLPDFVRTKGIAFLLYPGRAMLQELSTPR
jgi:deferrochelatase/peroxidase EfeB